MKIALVWLWNNTYIAYPENKYKPKKSSLNFDTYHQRTFQKDSTSMLMRHTWEKPVAETQNAMFCSALNYSHTGYFISVSLITSETKHLFTCLLALCFDACLNTVPIFLSVLCWCIRELTLYARLSSPATCVASILPEVSCYSLDWSIFVIKKAVCFI